MSVDVDGSEYTYRLEQGYPNPFNASTTISFSIPQQQLITIAIFDVRGRLIKQLMSSIIMPGNTPANGIAILKKGNRYHQVSIFVP